MKQFLLLTILLFTIPSLVFGATPTITSFTNTSTSLLSGQPLSFSWNISDSQGYSFTIPCVTGLKFKNLDGTSFTCGTPLVNNSPVATGGIDLVVFNLNENPVSFTANLTPLSTAISTTTTTRKQVIDIQGDMGLNEGVLYNSPYTTGWALSAFISMGATPRGDATPSWWTPANPIYKSATAWNGVGSWFLLHPAVGNASTTNTRIKISDMNLYILKKSTNTWEKLNIGTGNPAWAKSYNWYINNANALGAPSTRTESDGGVSYKLDSSSHPIHGGTGKVAMDGSDIKAIYASLKTQLVVDDPNKPDDRALAKILVEQGVDFSPDTATKIANFTPMNYSPPSGMSKFILAGTDSRTISYSPINPPGSNGTGSTYEKSGGQVAIPIADFLSNPPPGVFADIITTTTVTPPTPQTKSVGISPATNLIDSVSGASSVAQDTPYTLSWSSTIPDNVNLFIPCSSGVVVSTTLNGAVLPCDNFGFTSNLSNTGTLTLYFKNTTTTNNNVTLSIVPAVATNLYNQAQKKSVVVSVAGVTTVTQPPAPTPTPTPVPTPEPTPTPIPTPTPTPTPNGCTLFTAYSPLTGERCPQRTQMSTSTSIFMKQLYRGYKGEQVTILQQYFSKDTTLYPEGLITGYFGPATERAVKRFQERYNIASSGLPGYGEVGPKTRAVLNKLMN